jgi:hypothetical protein
MMLSLGRKAVRRLYPDLYVRPMIRYLKTLSLHDIVGVEIGTLYGENAKSILKNLDIYKLYLIDPYRIYSGYAENPEKHTDDAMFLKAKNNLKAYSNKVVFVRKMSEDAIMDVPDHVDFVYIDGNHAYEYVKKDIQLYFPKLKAGGVIGGDDFCASFPGVAMAVLEFVASAQLQLQGLNKDWWVQRRSSLLFLSERSHESST